MREMKDSGVEWIGQIPISWSTIKLKNTHNGMNVGESIDKDYWEESDGDKVFYTAGLNPITTTYQCFPPEKYTKGNDLLLARNGTPYVYLPKEGSVYTDHILRVIVKDEYSKKYIMYCLQRSIDAEIVDTVSIATWSASIWNRQVLPLPSYDEQKSIASFLDAKCAEIDSISEDIRKEIETLQEYRKSVITEAVTKGLDPAVEMKDSGVEWIGKINSKWSLIDLKYCLEEPLKYGASESGVEYCDSLPRYIRITDISMDGRLKDDNKLSLTEKQAEGFILKQNSILFARSGATVGKAFLYKTDYGRAAFAGYLISALPNDNMLLPEWLMYYTQSTIFKEWCSYIFSQATIQNIGADKYANLPLTIPSIYEQDKIVEYLDTKCAELDSIISDKHKQLDVLAEYRKSLIYEYVTGKKEVSTT